jgi:site-specific recombinase XerD
MNNGLNSLDTAQKEFINYLKNSDRATATILAYSKDSEQLIEFLKKRQIGQATSILPRHVEEFKKHLIEKDYTPKSVSRKLNSIKTFFRFLKERKVIAKNPAAPIGHPKYKVKPPRILTKMEYRALRDAARDDPRMSACIELMLQTGVRIGETARLQLDDVHEKEIFIRAYESHPKRKVPLNKAAKKALNRYLNFRPKSKSKNFFLTKTGRPFLVRNIRSAINRCFRQANVKNATPNDLRHTFIAHQLAGGASPVLIQKLVGHKRLSTTEKYLDFVDKQKEKQVRVEEL